MKHIEEQISFLKTVTKNNERGIFSYHKDYAIFGDQYHMTIIPQALFVLDIEKLRNINYIYTFSAEALDDMLIEAETVGLHPTGKELKHNKALLVEFERYDNHKLVYMQKKFLKNVDLKSASFEQTVTRGDNINGGIHVFENRQLVMYCMPHRVEYYKGANND